MPPHPVYAGAFETPRAPGLSETGIPPPLVGTCASCIASDATCMGGALVHLAACQHLLTIGTKNITYKHGFDFSNVMHCIVFIKCILPILMLRCIGPPPTVHHSCVHIRCDERTKIFHICSYKRNLPTASASMTTACFYVAITWCASMIFICCQRLARQNISSLTKFAAKFADWACYFR